MLWRDLAECNDARASAQIDLPKTEHERDEAKLALAATRRRLVQAPPPAPEPRSPWLDVLDVALPVGGAAAGAASGSLACSLADCLTLPHAGIAAAGAALGAVLGIVISPSK